jgi:hypothetical protein
MTHGRLITIFRRFAWLAVIWAMSVTSLGLVATILRWWLSAPL